MAGKNSDEVTKQKVQALLDSDLETRAYGVKADVIDGEVQLTGIVDTLSEKGKISRIVSGIQGVRGVENGVTISTDGAIDDEDVTFEVIEELNADPNLKHIGARSVKGTVFLKGKVDSKDDVDAAIKAASKARGVRNVVSQLDMEASRELTLEDIFHSQVNNDKESKGKPLL